MNGPGDAEAKKHKLQQVEGGKSINGLIDEVNNLEEKFHADIKSPLDKMRTDTLKKLLLGSTKGANIKHAFMGATLAMIASKPDMTQESL